MAAYGGQEAIAKLGNQIFVTLRKGKQWPPRTCSIRLKYEQNLGDLKQAVQKELGVPAQQQQLFWHGKEITDAMLGTTLLELNMHTGFGVRGYDTGEEPDYWPAVKKMPDGQLVEVPGVQDIDPPSSDKEAN